MHKALRIAGWLAAAIVLLLAALVAGLWWWAGTQHSLDWTLRRVAQSQALEADGVRGSLRTGLEATEIRWKQGGLSASATHAQLAWQPLALLRGTLRLDYLRAARVRMEDSGPPKPSVAPVDLGLPLRVEVGEVSLGELQWVTPARAIELAHVAGTYAFDGAQHRAKLDRLQWQGGVYSAEGSVGARGNMPVQFAVQGRFEAPVPGGNEATPLSFQAKLEGPIQAVRATASLKGPAGTQGKTAHADLRARLAPWAAQPVLEAHADFTQIDAHALWPQAPRTLLSGQLEVRPSGKDLWDLRVEATNALAGPWDQQKAPLERIAATGEWRMDGRAVIRTLVARAGGGDVKATGEWTGKDGWQVKATLAAIEPGAVYSTLASSPVSGTANARGEGSAIAFDVDVTASGSAPRRPAKEPLAAAVAALELRSATASGRWNDGVLSLPKLDVRTSDARLQAAVELAIASWSGRGKADLQAPGLQLAAEGSLSATQGAGTVTAGSGNLGQAAKWLARLPGVGQSMPPVTGGRAQARASWQGGWRDPALQADLQVPQADIRTGDPKAAGGWTLRDVSATVNGRLSDATVQLSGGAQQGQRKVALDASARGGRRAASPAAWQGRLGALSVTASDPATGTGTWSLRIARPVDVQWSRGTLQASAGEAVLGAPRSVGGASSASIAWAPVRHGGGELTTSGRITGLPLAWIEFAGGAQLAGSALSGDMVFDGQWDAQLGGAAPRIRASLARTKGDVIVLAETASGGSARVQAGVREARLAVETQGEQVTATLRWDSERGGTADGRLQSRLTRGGDAGWEWAATAPLAGTLNAQLPRIGVWSLLAPPGWRLRGSLVADVAIGGTRGDPQLRGTLSADDLALRSVVDGVELQGGRLRARFDGTRLVVDEFRLNGSGPNGGTLVATGEGRWGAAGLDAKLSAEVTRLRASIRSDRQLTVSGTVNAARDAKTTTITGKLAVDQALIVLPDESAPKLGDDIVVRGASGPILRAEAKALQQQQPGAGARAQTQEVKLDVALDLGSNFRVQGLGIDTRLRGELALTGTSLAQPRLAGTIRAVGGEYRAYGQRLDIERGIVRFNGAFDNPSLDILAIRPNMIQRVGVQITGNALAPFVRLYAEPDMPDAEKLSWLVTGRASPSSGAETALVQQAALALLASRSGSGRKGIAASLGLDELSFRRDGASGPAVTLGRRFGRNFYAAYERSISGALGTLFIFYDITRRVTLRAEAGERTAVDLILTFSFD